MEQNYCLQSRCLERAPRISGLAEAVEFIEKRGIEMVNFLYPAADGRLKTLNFAVEDRDYLLTILTSGERVDGSSLFPFIGTGNSDLYVVPRLSTMFLDPFSNRPAVCFLCAYLDSSGNRLGTSPEYTLLKARDVFRRRTGMDMEAMGELEYYVSAPETESLKLFPAVDQRGYHESGPFAKFNGFRTECMYRIMKAGGRIKYGHSEVGNFRLDGRIYEQNEIEFIPVDVVSAADQLMLAKWIIRNTAVEYGLDVCFAPKITAGKAGSGMHIHFRFMKDGRNMLVDEDGKLSQTARRAIAGMMELAPSITAFGNANPVSYLRLVPHQEAPTSICWGDRNRSVLVRVPLGWTSSEDFCSLVNGPGALGDSSLKPASKVSRQTIEIRSADCTADIYQLLASLCTACMYGLELPEADEIARKTYVDVDIHKTAGEAMAATLAQLPASCAESADMLEKHRAVYERDGVFTPTIIDGVIARLRSYGDADLRERMKENRRLEAELVEKYYYCA